MVEGVQEHPLRRADAGHDPRSLHRDREGRRIDVSGLCLASGAAPTMALRYVELLVDDALIAKVGDADDGRRLFINVSGTLRDVIDEWLDQPRRD